MSADATGQPGLAPAATAEYPRTLTSVQPTPIDREARSDSTRGLRRPTPPGQHEHEMIAYRLDHGPMRLVAASATRPWMGAMGGPYRCLPMLIANQAGWFVVNDQIVRVTWNGGGGRSDLSIEYLSGGPPYPAVSHFGNGILTWQIPFLFRTPPGYNLLARGPANWPKHGAYPLEGMIEADWSVAPFTMNWKLTGIDQPVVFQAGEPICMLVPQQRAVLEAIHPVVRNITTDPELEAGLDGWHQSRRQFIVGLEEGDADAVKQGWQRTYFRGVRPDGTLAPEHQVKLKLREFDDAGGCGPTPELARHRSSQGD